MSKGKSKPKTPVDKSGGGPGQWEISLTSNIISDAELSIAVHLLSPAKAEDLLQLHILKGAVDLNVRKKFVFIDKETLVAKAKEQSKSKDSSKLPFSEVFGLMKSADECNSSPVLSKLLKIKVLSLRNAELALRDELQKGSNLTNTKNRGRSAKQKAGAGSKTPNKSASPEKGKKDKKGGKKSPTKKVDTNFIDPEAEVPRGKCPLKKRGEEKDPLPIIEDYPINGPHLYILCVGFDLKDFLVDCNKINLPINSLIKVSSESYSEDLSFYDHLPGCAPNAKVVISDEEREAQVKARLSDIQGSLDLFWEHNKLISTQYPLPKFLVDTAFQALTLPRITLDEESKKDDLFMDDLKLGVYERFAKKLYEIQESFCQFKQYMRSMEVIDVVDLSERNEDGTAKYNLDMKYYNKMVSTLPYESVTPVSILNIMLEQVCNEQIKDNESEIVVQAEEDDDDDPVKIDIARLISVLPLSLNQQTEFQEFLDFKKNRKNSNDQPVVLKHGDDLTMNSFHLKPNHYTLNDRCLLKHLVCNKLLELPKSRVEILAKIQSISNEIESFCGDIGGHSIKKALTQFAFESADLSRCSPGFSPLKDPTEYFWDIEHLLGLTDEPKDVIIEKLKAIKQLELKQNLDEFCYKSLYEEDTLVQVLSEAFYTYPFVERIYHRHDHSMLLAFHAAFSPSRNSLYTWKERLHTTLGFHLFVSRTQDEFVDLLSGLPVLTPPPVTPVVSVEPTPIPAIEIESDEEFKVPENRLEGFKKRSEIKEEMEKERAQSGKKGKKSPAKSRAKGSPSPKRKESPAKSGKVSRSGSSTKSKVRIETPAEPEIDIVLDTEPYRNLFTGFKFPNEILEITGDVHHCHPADGGVVRVEKWCMDGKTPQTRLVLLSSRHVFTLSYTLKSDSDLRAEKLAAEKLAAEKLAAEKLAAEAKQKELDSAVAEKNQELEDGRNDDAVIREETEETSSAAVEVSPQPLAKARSFTAQLACGINLSFKKPDDIQVLVHETAAAEPEETTEPADGEPPQEEVNRERPSVKSILTASLPIGLVLEYCQKLDDEDFYAVRQTYEKKSSLRHNCEEKQKKALSEECSRLYLSSGAVVKLMKSGETHILYSDGSIAIRYPVSTPNPKADAPVADNASVAENENAGAVTPAEEQSKLQWDITRSNGEREQIFTNGDKITPDPLHSYIATDPESKEIMKIRIDNLIAVKQPDGTGVVNFEDGTRITTLTDESDSVVEYKIESPEYATVRFDAISNECETTFGTSVVIYSYANSWFEIIDNDLSKLSVYPCDMRAEFKPNTYDINPDTLNTIRETGNLRFTKPGVYNFNIEQDLCFEHCDIAGNIFNVSYDGEIAVENPDAHVVEHLDHCYKDYNVTYEEVEQDYTPPIRLFVVHPDRTGTEIMRYVDCKDMLEANKADPKMIKLEEEVENVEDAKAYTFLSPYHESSGFKWIPEFKYDIIIPHGLKYDGNVRPQPHVTEGTESRPGSPDDQDLPPAIYFHHIVEHDQVTPYEREAVLNGLTAHTKWLIEQEKHSKRATIPDERSNYEKEQADSLIMRTGPNQSKPPTREGSQEVFLESISKHVEEADQLSELSFKTPPTSRPTAKPTGISTDSVTRKYSSVVFANPMVPRMSLKKGIIPKAKWDQLMREKMEVEYLKSDLREFRIPPYFESKFGEEFLSSLRDGPPMIEYSDQVPSPRPASSDAPLETTSSTIPPSKEDHGSMQNLLDLENSYSKLPAPSPKRPVNPTPSKAKQKVPPIPKNSTADTTAPPTEETLPHDADYAFSSPEQYTTTRLNTQTISGPVRSLFVDVKGDPRNKKVKTPRCIKGYKPGAEPNTKFLETDDLVRRSMKTSSVLGATTRIPMQNLRGFQVYPPEVSFGVLCPAGLYSTSVTLKNIGVDSCRFRVRCPVNNFGVIIRRDISHGNNIPAGLSDTFDVCIKTRNVDLISHVAMTIDIVSETEVFHLPVTATILPIEEYDQRSKSGKLKKLARHIKIVDVRSVVNGTSSESFSEMLSGEWYVVSPTFL